MTINVAKTRKSSIGPVGYDNFYGRILLKKIAFKFFEVV